MEDQTVYILCGHIASGKSTWAEQVANNNDKTIIVCRDDLRRMLKGKYVYEKKVNDFVRVLADDIILSALQKGFNVIIDEVNITKTKRAHWINLIREYNIMYVPHHLNAPLRVNIEIIHFTNTKGNVERRMAADSRGVSKERWKSTFESMCKDFVVPSVDELPTQSVITTVNIGDKNE